MVDLLFVWVGFVIGLADTLGNDLGIAFLVTGIFAVGALHPGRILEKFSAQSAPHHIIELLLDKLVSLLFVNFFLLLSDRALSIETNIERPSSAQLFLKAHR